MFRFATKVYDEGTNIGLMVAYRSRDVEVRRKSLILKRQPG